MQPCFWNGADILFSHATEPLGTGGGIRLALDKCNENEVFVVNGDSFFDVNLTCFHENHHRENSHHSLALREVANAARYGTVQLNDVGSRIIKFKEKSGEEKNGLINGGVYILNKAMYQSATPKATNFSIEKDFFEKQLFKQSIMGFEFDGYFIDIGIPEDYSTRTA